MATEIQDQFFEEVAALGESVKDVVIPFGKTWEVQRFIGASAYMDDTTVKLVWDHGGASEEILAATHGDLDIQIIRQLVGDGMKKLALVLTNDTTANSILGATFEALEFDT